MSSRNRTVLTNTPIKLIAVILFALLVPSLVITALGLVQVYLADVYVRSRLGAPIEANLSRLGEHAGGLWSARLEAYAAYVRDGAQRSSYLARLRRDDSAVREILVRNPGGLRLVDPSAPRALGTDAPREDLRRLGELEVEAPEAALAEARRLLGTSEDEVVEVEALLSAARMSFQLEDLEEAQNYLKWTLERFGRTTNGFGIVREVPILLRLAELAKKTGSSGLFRTRLRQAAAAWRSYARYMPPDAVNFFRERIETLAPAGNDVADLGKVPIGPHSDSALTAADVKALAQRLRIPMDGSHERVFHVDGLDFMGFWASDDSWVFILLSLEGFLQDVAVSAPAFGLAARATRLRDPLVETETDGTFAIVAPYPFERYELTYTPPSTGSNDGFGGFNVVSLATFTWAVIILVATVLLGSFFTLRYILRELETARLKTDFVSFVTHELKTPLTAIRMYAETMADDRLEDQADRDICIRMIDQESRRLSKLIDQILEYSKIERRQKKFQFTSCSMIEVIEQSVQIFHDHSAENKREVEVNAAQHVSKMRMDRAAMIELLLNLLNNAAKYSAPETKITVNLRESISEIAVEVVDRGVGIRKRDQKRIFDRFYRSDDYLTRDVDGTGLGLTFARYIAKVHSGDIRVSSQLGGGSSFTLVLRKTTVLAG